MSKPSLTYRDAGVDINAGNELVQRIKSISRKTKRPEVMGSLGGFGALCEIPQGYDQPVLVSGTDGVGTKLKLAIELNKHDTVGIDLVGMCVNDLIVTGAEPLFFLDYYASGKLDIDAAASVISGIGEGCQQAGCALVGGETAEMPGLYEGDDYDLAGFCVGVVEKAKIIDGSQVSAGNVLIALGSSGPHSNGYSLIRKILTLPGISIDDTLDGKPLADILMAPTRIYVSALQNLTKEIPVNAIAHITGGGLLENIPRVLPQNTRAEIDTDSWQWPKVFQWLQEKGQVETEEMYRTFNCGVGMVLCIPADYSDKALGLLKKAGEDAWVIGSITPGSNTEPYVVLPE